MDNWYSSNPLFRTLLSHSTFALGTIRPNRREYPKELVKESKKFSYGQSSFRQNEHLVAYSFFDRKAVFFLSSFHAPNQDSTIERRDNSGESKSISVPSAVKDYNSYRSGVDTIDQRLSYYSLPRKSRQWWPRLAWWLIDVAIANAHRLYQIQIDPKCTVLDFWLKLMHELGEDSDSTSFTTTSKRHNTLQHSPLGHWPSESAKRGRCQRCFHVRGTRRDVSIKCELCDVYLCMDPCFKEHHSSMHQ